MLTLTAYDALYTGSTFYQQDLPRQHFLVSPPMGSTDLAYRRRSSNSPQTVLGTSLSRDRTPIRHTRPNIPLRNRSFSRGEMLMAYAAEQNQLHESQSLPSMVAMTSQPGPSSQQMYGMPSYTSTPSISGFSHQGSYLATPIPQHPSQRLDFALVQNEADPQSYYPVGRTMSHGSTMSLSGSTSPQALYVQRQNVPSQQRVPPMGSTTMQGYINMPPNLEATAADIEIVPSRPKPQCWDHGCNGRQFSTFSNLLRHQREKSGNASKAVCPHCGTEFTRTTARNGHMSGGKCKGKADAEARNRAAGD